MLLAGPRVVDVCAFGMCIESSATDFHAQYSTYRDTKVRRQEQEDRWLPSASTTPATVGVIEVFEFEFELEQRVPGMSSSSVDPSSAQQCSSASAGTRPETSAPVVASCGLTLTLTYTSSMLASSVKHSTLGLEVSSTALAAQ